MNMTPQGTYIIRDRGQLTIPNKIRKVLNWDDLTTAVSMYTTSDNELVIKSYRENKKTDWKKIWKYIKKYRNEKGRQGNYSEFVIKDRESH